MVHLRCPTNASSCEDPRYRADAIEFRMEPHERSIPYVGALMPHPACCKGRDGWPLVAMFCRRDNWICFTVATICRCGNGGMARDDYYRAKLLKIMEEECRLRPEAPPACGSDKVPNCTTDEPTRCSSKVLDRFGYDPDNPYNQRPWVRCSLEAGHEGDHDGGCLCWANMEDEKKRIGC